ncbi:unnamed protein product [Chrysoparadoxa australica]
MARAARTIVLLQRAMARRSMVIKCRREVRMITERREATLMAVLHGWRVAALRSRYLRVGLAKLQERMRSSLLGRALKHWGGEVRQKVRLRCRVLAKVEQREAIRTVLTLRQCWGALRKAAAEGKAKARRAEAMREARQRELLMKVLHAWRGEVGKRVRVRRRSVERREWHEHKRMELIVRACWGALRGAVEASQAMEEAMKVAGDRKLIKRCLGRWVKGTHQSSRLRGIVMAWSAIACTAQHTRDAAEEQYLWCRRRSLTCCYREWAHAAGLVHRLRGRRAEIGMVLEGAVFDAWNMYTRFTMLRREVQAEKRDARERWRLEQELLARCFDVWAAAVSEAKIRDLVH